MSTENRLPQATRDLAEKITQTYRKKPGYTDPDLRKEAVEEYRRRQGVSFFDTLPEAVKYAAGKDENLSILATPEGRYCVALGSGYAVSIFAGCRMVAFNPTGEDLSALTSDTDTIEEV